jgi:hypothetical protein
MVGAAEEVASSTSDEAVAVDPEHRAYQPMSTRGPALIVLGIAIFIVVLGIVGSILASRGSSTRLPSTVTVDGSAVRLTPAATAMKSIVSGGQPPSDIIGNLVVPAGSPVVRTLNIDQGVTQFDRTVYFTTQLSTDQVISLYRSVLPGLGWTVTYHGPQTNGPGTELLAKRGSGDGFYWEAGVVASPTTSAGTTPFSVEVLEMSDDT